MITLSLLESMVCVCVRERDRNRERERIHGIVILVNILNNIVLRTHTAVLLRAFCRSGLSEKVFLGLRFTLDLGLEIRSDQTHTHTQSDSQTTPTHMRYCYLYCFPLVFVRFLSVLGSGQIPHTASNGLCLVHRVTHK